MVSGLPELDLAASTPFPASIEFLVKSSADSRDPSPSSSGYSDTVIDKGLPLTSFLVKNSLELTRELCVPIKFSWRQLLHRWLMAIPRREWRRPIITSPATSIVNLITSTVSPVIESPKKVEYTEIPVIKPPEIEIVASMLDTISKNFSSISVVHASPVIPVITLTSTPSVPGQGNADLQIGLTISGHDKAVQSVSFTSKSSSVAFGKLFPNPPKIVHPSIVAILSNGKIDSIIQEVGFRGQSDFGFSPLRLFFDSSSSDSVVADPESLQDEANTFHINNHVDSDDYPKYYIPATLNYLSPRSVFSLIWTIPTQASYNWPILWGSQYTTLGFEKLF